ncbi:MAG: hypothetical protein AB7S41_18915 [Parvibaculaceae bacterium]
MQFAAATLAMITGIGLAQAEVRVENVRGPVSVNQGEGFSPVLGSYQLNAGDRVMADKGGSAIVVYNQDCKVPVKPGAVVVVMSRAPCLKTSADLEESSSRALDGDTPDWVVPAAAMGVIGGGVVAIILLTDNNNGGGVSP